jgi:SSS family solute:Na+ symporter
MESGLSISTLDLVIIIVYLVGIMVVGILVGYRKKTSSEQFFLAGKSLRWPVIGAAL